MQNVKGLFGNARRVPLGKPIKTPMYYGPTRESGGVVASPEKLYEDDVVAFTLNLMPLDATLGYWETTQLEATAEFRREVVPLLNGQDELDSEKVKEILTEAQRKTQTKRLLRSFRDEDERKPELIRIAAQTFFGAPAWEPGSVDPGPYSIDAAVELLSLPIGQEKTLFDMLSEHISESMPKPDEKSKVSGVEEKNSEPSSDTPSVSDDTAPN